MTRLFDGFMQMGPSIDLLLDGSGMEGLDVSSLLVFTDWTRDRLDELRRRVHRQVGVISPGVIAFMLAGIMPIVGAGWPLTVLTDRREALRRLLPDGGDALCDELTALAQELSGVAPVVMQLRRLLAERQGQMTLSEAARAMGLSSRSLQRALGAGGSTYREEQQQVHFRRAEELLAGDEKIGSIASRLGLSDRALTALVRARSGLTPTELRERLRLQLK
jgi:AraC-like DNA-binding protein